MTTVDRPLVRIPANRHTATGTCEIGHIQCTQIISHCKELVVLVVLVVSQFENRRLNRCGLSSVMPTWLARKYCNRQPRANSGLGIVLPTDAISRMLYCTPWTVLHKVIYACQPIRYGGGSLHDQPLGQFRHIVPTQMVASIRRFHIKACLRYCGLPRMAQRIVRTIAMAGFALAHG